MVDRVWIRWDGKNTTVNYSKMWKAMKASSEEP